MGKPFEELTEAGFGLLEKILECPNTLPSDFWFDEPTVDGQLELLQKANLVVLDDKNQLSITELGRAALKHHDYIKEQDALTRKQHAEELEAFKSIANGAQKQAEFSEQSAKTAAEQAKSAAELVKSAAELAKTAADSSKTSTKYSRISTALSIIAIIISIIAIRMQ